jgi:hypothetical protein
MKVDAGTIADAEKQIPFGNDSERGKSNGKSVSRKGR